MTTESLPRGAAKGSVSVVWVFALAAGALIAIFSHPRHDGAWLSLALAASVLLALCIQLATKEKRGFVHRLAASVSGAAVILVIATVTTFLLHA